MDTRTSCALRTVLILALIWVTRCTCNDKKGFSMMHGIALVLVIGVLTLVFCPVFNGEQADDGEEGFVGGGCGCEEGFVGQFEGDKGCTYPRCGIFGGEQ